MKNALSYKWGMYLMLYRSTYLYDSPGALRMHGNDNSIEISMGILRDQKLIGDSIA
jgi:hypothetical protein